MADLSGIEVEQLAWGLADALERASHAAYEQRRADEQAAAFRAELAKRLTVGEAVLVDESHDGGARAPKPSGRRSVNVEAVHRHIEVLGPLGLGPETVVKESFRYPTLAELTRRAAVLQAHGIDVEELVVTPPLGEPQVVVRPVKQAVST